MVEKSRTHFIQNLPTNLNSKIPIIFIHGFPFNHEMWLKQLDLLKTERRAVAYDVRCHGRTKLSPIGSSIDLFADDLADLMDHLKFKKAILCGLSMGGYIALRFFEKYATRVAGLVLCDTKSTADTNDGKIKRFDSIKKIRKSRVSEFADSFSKNAVAKKTSPKILQFVKKMIESNSADSICASLLALAARTDTTLALKAIHVPTLVIVGEEDKLTPPSDSQKMISQIPDGILKIIPGVGHLSNLENPDEFNSILKSFLSELL
ncbi:MAG: alpha/beta fold hydrolase [Deltaproteobacteria bacterium]|nr:alpha/beta fold hydrolase [Deltaproteobacteria bacterium]